MALQADGKIVVARQSYDSGGYDLASPRYDSEEVPDDTFDGDGVATTSFTPNHDGANAVLISSAERRGSRTRSRTGPTRPPCIRGARSRSL